LSTDTGGDRTTVPILKCVNVTKSFGGVHAVNGMSLSVPKNQIVSLIGPNGAGKTTLFNCLTGLQTRDAGEILFHGKSVPARSLQDMARLGVVRTFQNIRMFAGLTIYESLIAAQTAHFRSTALESILGLPRHRREWRAMRERVEEILVMLGLGPHRHSIAQSLPLLVQRKTEIARALAADPEILLLDEPTAGATVSEAEELIGVMRDLKGKGRTILLIEHNMRLVMKVSDYVNVMNFGSLLASGTPNEVRANDLVRAVYLGSRA
jgi:branched-chain amino acid transport system ATP-binding protein